MLLRESTKTHAAPHTQRTKLLAKAFDSISKVRLMIGHNTHKCIYPQIFILFLLPATLAFVPLIQTQTE